MGRSSSSFKIADAFGDLIIYRLEHLDLHGSGGARRKLFGDGLFGAFVQRQDFAGALDHRDRQSRQPRYFDAIAAVGAARLNLAQERSPGRPLPSPKRADCGRLAIWSASSVSSW